MVSFFRRAGAAIARVIESLTDPAAEADRALLYAKEDLAGVTQLFARASDGTISQLSPLAAAMAGGNTVLVDNVFGNDTTGARQGLPFATVAAGLAAALPNDSVIVRPGVYNLAAGLVIPDGVTLVGSTIATTRLEMLGVVADTTLLTMGNNSQIGFLRLRLTSALHVNLTCVDFPALTAISALIRTCRITVDNAGAGAGSSDVIGIKSDGTGAAGQNLSNLTDVDINVASTGGGAKRGIRVGGPSTLTSNATNVVVLGAGAGTYIGVETSHAGAVCTLQALISNASGADISQTLGVLQVGGATWLVNRNANGLGFESFTLRTVLTFGDAGTLVNGTRYFYPGTEPTSSTPVFMRVPNPGIAKSLSVRASVAPGGADSCTVTVQKNGVDTGITVTLTGAQLTGLIDTVSMGFAPGDDLSLKVVETGATADVICVVELF